MKGNSLEKKVQYGSAFLDEIDFTRTRAYFAQDKGVWINLKGREREGIVRDNEVDKAVEESRQALLNLVSPIDGIRIFESVLRREEAFNGLNVNRLPDLVMIPLRDEYVYNERPGYGETVVTADSTTGTHAKDGIFIAWGKGIENQASFQVQPNLRDIGTTALASLGCQLTTDADGRVIEEVFSESLSIKRHGTSYRSADERQVEPIYKADEEAELRERMRALGYIE